MLGRIIQFSIRNKMLLGVLILAWIFWGVWSLRQLPIDALPDITNNQVQIITVCPTLAPQEVEQLVTFPIEQTVVSIPDLVETRSISMIGLSVVTVVFKENVDIYFARQLLQEKLKEAEEQIPKEVEKPTLSPVSTGLGEVFQYVLLPDEGSEHKYSLNELRTLQDWVVARQLYGTPGVAEVNSYGGELKQYEVAIDPHKLRVFELSITDVLEALENNNENTGGAYIDKKPQAFFIRGLGLLNNLEEIESIAITKDRSVPVYIRDVANVQIGHAIRYGALTMDGEKEVVGGVVMMLKGANSHDVVKQVKERIAQIETALPDDISIVPYLDRTDLISRTIQTVKNNLVGGALIVILVLVLFLGNLRAGLIVASAIPLSMLFAFGMMHLFGVSANLMSLGAIDFGLIVDGAVIVVEATMFHIGMRTRNRTLTQPEMDHEVFISASKIRKSAAFGEIIILMVYIPILTLVGIEGKMFKPMAMTVCFALLGALILSMTYIPMMCALFLSKKPHKGDTLSDRIIKVFQSWYHGVLTKVLKRNRIVLGASALLLIISLGVFNRMGAVFIPQLQEGDFAFHCIIPTGSSLSQSLETSMQASRIIKSFPEVDKVIGKTGAAEVPTDPMPPEVTDLMIVLKPEKEWTTGRTYEQLGDELMEALSILPGVFFEKNQPIQMRFNELMTGIRQDVAIKIFGNNLEELAHLGQEVSHIIEDVPGVTTPQVERVGGLPMIQIRYDRMKMAQYGLSVKDVNMVVSTAFAGSVTGTMYEEERRFDLVVRLQEPFRANIEDVQQMLVATSSGQLIPLYQIANIEEEYGPAQISRDGGQRRIVIGFNVEGRDIKSVIDEIEPLLKKELDLPTGYYISYGGQFEQLEEASNRLLIAVPGALLIILFLLYFTFHSFKQALLIFTAIPMSAIGGIWLLWARGMPFSISAGVGFIALFGVAVLNGIVLISMFNQLEKEGIKSPIKRIILGTKIRLRPVLMTASVASLGFFPMALSTGAGAEVQKPLATVVIGGLVTATILTLFVLPILYLMMHSKKSKKNALEKPTF